MPVTFGSVGDIIALAQLVKDLVEALHKSRGAAAEYQSLIRDLEILEGTLQHLEISFQTQQDTPEVSALYETGRRIEAACSQSIRAFQARIEKYDHDLGDADVNKVRATFAKFRWQTGEKGELANFRVTIAGHIASMNMLLNAINMAINQDNRANLKAMQASNQDHWTKQESSLSGMMRAINEIARMAAETRSISSSILGSLRFFQQVGCQLMTGLSQIIYINFATYRAVLAIQAALPSQFDRMLLGEHFLLEDATGRTCPIHLQCITSWETFDYILADRFVGKPGHDKVCKGEYALQERHTSLDVSRKRIWEGSFTPGEWYDMSMIFVRESKADQFRSMNIREIASCPWCQTDSSGSPDREIQCSICGRWYRRIDENIELEPEHIYENLSVSEVDSQWKAPSGRSLSKPKFGPERPPNPSKHNDTKVDDVASFKRVRILLRHFLYKTTSSVDTEAPSNVSSMIDEGYITMSKPGDLDQTSVAGNVDTIRIEDVDPELSLSARNQLSLLFAQDILENVESSIEHLASTTDEICSSLPGLLRELSTSIAKHAKPGVEQQACTFIRHQRNHITRELKEMLTNMPLVASDAHLSPTARERIDLLWGKDHSVNEPIDAPDDGHILDLDFLKETTDPRHDLVVDLDIVIAQARRYILERPEYGWLLNQVLTKARILT